MHRQRAPSSSRRRPSWASSSPPTSATRSWRSGSPRRWPSRPPREAVMGWTKEQLIDEAFAELRLAGYTFDIAPEEKQTALRRMDTMMATWEGRGIRVGYPLPSSPDGSDI